MMRLGFGILAATLMLIAVNIAWHSAPEVPEQRLASIPQSSAQPMPAMAALPSTQPKVLAAPPAQHCETSQIHGSHTALFEWEARQGALEDVADVCPAGKVQPTQMQCAPVNGAQGIMGSAAIKCVQQAACTLCGEDLKRQREVDYAAFTR